MAEEAKTLGNQLFKEGDFQGAIKCYTQAVNLPSLQKKKRTPD
jgi:hypothetical protein